MFLCDSGHEDSSSSDPDRKGKVRTCPQGEKAVDKVSLKAESNFPSLENSTVLI